MKTTKTGPPHAPETPAAAVSEEILPGRLEARAPGNWELYAKSAESFERVATGDASRAVWRREEGWAARTWADNGPRFAAGTSPETLLAALADAERFAPEVEAPPDWPTHTATSTPASPVEAPPELFAELASAVREAANGVGALSRLALRRGRVSERILNGRGLAVVQSREELDGVATVVGHRGERAVEVRLAFAFGNQAPDVPALARRLADAASLPLAEPSAPPSNGEWLLDPAIGAALLAAIAPVFTSERPPRWIVRGSLASPDTGVADDASSDAPFDGEGVATRRVLLVEEGRLAGTLHDLRSAKRAGRSSTGHGVRTSFRTPPAPGPRRIFFETKTPRPAAELLAAVRRGVYASSLISPVRVDLEADRYEIEFTGVAVTAGRARGSIPAARSTGRLSELLRRIRALSKDAQFFPLPFPAGAPTILVERANFE